MVILNVCFYCYWLLKKKHKYWLKPRVHKSCYNHRHFFRHYLFALLREDVLSNSSFYFISNQVYIHLQANSACVTVQSNDVLGIYAPVRNPIAYNFVNTGADVNRYAVNTVPSVGDVVTFDTLQAPYDFSVAAWIDTGR